jgi:hypothetical protein
MGWRRLLRRAPAIYYTQLGLFVPPPPPTVARGAMMLMTAATAAACTYITATRAVLRQTHTTNRPWQKVCTVQPPQHLCKLTIWTWCVVDSAKKKWRQEVSFS